MNIKEIDITQFAGNKTATDIEEIPYEDIETIAKKVNELVGHMNGIINHIIKTDTPL